MRALHFPWPPKSGGKHFSPALPVSEKKKKLDNYVGICYAVVAIGLQVSPKNDSHQLELKWCSGVDTIRLV